MSTHNFPKIGIYGWVQCPQLPKKRVHGEFGFSSWCERRERCWPELGVSKIPFIIGVLRSCHTGFDQHILVLYVFFFSIFLSAKDYLAVEDGGLFFHERDALGVCPE